MSGDPGDLGDLGRFAEPSLLILVSLSDQPRHGYAIMADVEQLSGTSLGPGTLYAALAWRVSCGLGSPASRGRRTLEAPPAPGAVRRR